MCKVQTVRILMETSKKILRNVWSTSVWFLIWTLMKGNEPVVTEKNESDNRKNSEILAFFWKWGVEIVGILIQTSKTIQLNADPRM